MLGYIAWTEKLSNVQTYLNGGESFVTKASKAYKPDMVATERDEQGHFKKLRIFEFYGHFYH